MNLKELTKKIPRFIWSLSSATILVFVTVWLTGSSYAQSLDKVIDSRIDNRIDIRLEEKVMPILMEMNMTLQFIAKTQQNEYIKLIEKQVGKMKTDPRDIKETDIIYILDTWADFPIEYKTDALIVQYGFIKKYYENMQGQSQ